VSWRRIRTLGAGMVVTWLTVFKAHCGLCLGQRIRGADSPSDHPPPATDQQPQPHPEDDESADAGEAPHPSAAAQCWEDCDSGGPETLPRTCRDPPFGRVIHRPRPARRIRYRRLRADSCAKWSLPQTGNPAHDSWPATRAAPWKDPKHRGPPPRRRHHARIEKWHPSRFRRRWSRGRLGRSG
jgi:hypothetical protein